jgi:serine/threonine protein kinase
LDIPRMGRACCAGPASDYHQIPGNNGGRSIDPGINYGLLETASAEQKVFAEILAAGLYLHENQIVHGDLKPDSIAIRSVDSEGHPKLINSGFSMPTAILTGEAKYGTLTLAAPELHEHRQYDAAAVDV